MVMMDRLAVIFRRVFDDDSIILTAETTADNIEGWDSLSHINLILGIEQEFQIEFTKREAIGFRNVGELVAHIEAKFSSRR